MRDVNGIIEHQVLLLKVEVQLTADVGQLDFWNSGALHKSTFICVENRVFSTHLETNRGQTYVIMFEYRTPRTPTSEECRRM